MRRKANLFLIFVGMLLLAGCGAARPEWKAEELSVAQLQATKVTLRESSCAWGCWSHEVTVTGSGDVISLDGSKIVRSAHLEEADVRDLFGAFYRAQSRMPCEPKLVTNAKTGEMNLERSVGNCETYARSANWGVIGNDLPTTSIEVTVAGETFVYSGNLGVPNELGDLEKRLHSLE